MKVTIESKTAKACEMLGKFGNNLGHEVADGLNAAGNGVKKDIIDGIAQHYGVSRDVAAKATRREQKRGVKRWRRLKADYDKLESTTIVEGLNLPLYEMGAAPTGKMVPKTTGGVSVTLKGRRHNFPHAFVTDRYGYLGVYGRRRDKKYYNRDRQRFEHPIKQLTTESLPQMADDDKIVESIAEKATKRFVEKFDKSVKKLLK